MSDPVGLDQHLRADTGVTTLSGQQRAYLHDETQTRALKGRADAIALPESTAEVAAAVAWCYRHDVPITVRGGGSGFAGGAVPLDGGVVLGLERLRGRRSFDPEYWRLHVEAGLKTAEVQRLARENGLLFPPDPGAAEQSQIGGNVATNAGGPHAFKYGVTGRWVTGLEAVIPPGDVIEVGGPVRKDVAGYDIKSLLVGSEGTLGIVTAVWLRLIPAPVETSTVLALYPDSAAGCAAIVDLIANGVEVSALEYLDAATVDLARGGFPLPPRLVQGFMVIVDIDGEPEAVARIGEDAIELLSADALHATRVASSDRSAFWRWREGVSLAVTSRRGGKVSEDIAVPVERLRDAVEGTLEIGMLHGLEACSWGHAGDGNVHATFLFDPGDSHAAALAERAADDLFALAVALGGTISGEHGTGWVKRGQLARQWTPESVAVHAKIKAVFDPKGLLNPGKKT